MGKSVTTVVEMGESVTTAVEAGQTQHRPWGEIQVSVIAHLMYGLS